MKEKWRKAALECRNEQEAYPVKIVSDAGISSRGTADGKLIPLVIIDTTDRPDIEELVRVHEKQSFGDVVCQWGQLEGEKGKISLYLYFKRPTELVMILQFDMVRQGILVDQAINSKAIYIQPGRDGDRFATTIDSHRILIEIPDTGFKDEWERLFLKHIALDMRKKGLNRQQAKQAAQNLLNELRGFGKFRMKRL